jgi:hypothetical protein
MDTLSEENRAQDALRKADTYVRENPVPAVLWALGIGFAIGLLVRVLEHTEKKSFFDDPIHETEDYLGSVFHPLAKKTRKAYYRSADAVRDAVDSARDIDVDDYTDPVVSWVRRMWKRCCS